MSNTTDIDIENADEEGIHPENVESEEEIETSENNEPDVGDNTSEENISQDIEEEVETDEDVVLVGEEEINAPESRNAAPEWVRKLRKSHRELQSENKELAKKLASLEKPQSSITSLGPKPNLEDFDYDTTKYEEQLATWYEKKQNVDKLTAQQNLIAQRQQQEWQQKLGTYEKAKSHLRVRDFEEAESAVVDILDQTKQGIIVQGAENPALLIYALGKNQNLARDLSEIDDPIRFAFEVAKLEKTLKVKKRKAPPPERAVKNTGAKTDSTDSVLEKLRAEADRTGDQTKVIRYRRELAAKKNNKR